MEEQQAFYEPKWDGEKWIEGKTVEEIEDLKNKILEPSLEDRLDSAEEMLTMLMGV